MATKQSSVARPLRVCDVCNQADDHPRHVQPRPNAVPLTRHMDCCAEQGCPICTETETDNGGLRAQALIDHLADLRKKG